MCVAEFVCKTKKIVTMYTKKDTGNNESTQFAFVFDSNWITMDLYLACAVVGIQTQGVERVFDSQSFDSGRQFQFCNFPEKDNGAHPVQSWRPREKQNCSTASAFHHQL